MKVLLVLATLFVAVQLAEIPWTDPSAKDGHYTSHRETVTAARRGVEERLQEFGDNSAQLVAANGDGQYNGGKLCTVSCGNGASASSSDAELIDQSSIGVGYVGFNGQQESANSEFSSQSELSQQSTSGAANTASLIIPIAGPSGSNSHSHYAASAQEEHISGGSSAPVAVVLPISTNAGETERYSSSHSEHLSETSAAAAAPSPVIYTPVYAPESRYASNARYVNQHQQRIVESARPAPILLSAPVAAASSNSERYSSSQQLTSETESVPTVQQVHITYPAANNGAERSYIRSERITEHKVAAAPAPQYHTIIYHQPAPVANTESHISRSERLTTHRAASAIPTPIVYQPITVQRPSERYVSSSSASRAEQYRNAGGLQTAQPLYTYPVVSAPVASSHSSRYVQSHSAAQQQQQQQQPQVGYIAYAAPQPAASAASSYRSAAYAANENYANAASNAGGLYVPTLYAPGGASNSASSNFAQRASSRVASSRYTGGASADLSHLISESERLAREQSLQGTTHGASVIESSADFGRSASASSLFDENTNSLGGGGGRLNNGNFVRTKAWENNEKWSSGTQFDQDGRPRTYSTLSTAESEHHNVNGKTAGYRAATTTLENDGRVSTYSLHT